MILKLLLLLLLLTYTHITLFIVITKFRLVFMLIYTPRAVYTLYTLPTFINLRMFILYAHTIQYSHTVRIHTSHIHTHTYCIYTAAETHAQLLLTFQAAHHAL